MKPLRVILLPLLATLLVAPGTSEARRRERPTRLDVDPALLDAAVASVDLARWSTTVKALSGEVPVSLPTGEEVRIASRHSSAVGNTWASGWLAGELGALGYEVEVQAYDASTGAERNVIATRRGTRRPDEIILLGAHYDSTSEDPSLAPGADDNASGVATVLEAARILAGYSTERTVTIAFFGSEEQGLEGSEAWAAQAVEEGLDVRGAVICDMVGWYDRRFKLVVEGNLKSAPWMDGAVEAAEAYTDLDVSRHWFSFASDHVSLQDVGFPTYLLIEADWFRAPHYHTSDDTWENIRPELGEAVTRTVVAVVGEAAGLTR